MIAELWAKQIEAGKKTLEQVPARLKNQVIEILKKDGFIK